MDEHLGKLSQALEQGNLIPFIGAGVSAAIAGLPSWVDLRDRCIAHEAVAQSPDAAEIQSSAALPNIARTFGMAKRVRVAQNARAHLHQHEHRIDQQPEAREAQTAQTCG